MEKVDTGIYKHFKGKESLVLLVAKHSDTEEELVVYFGLSDRKMHARPLSDFCADVVVDGQTIPRFSLVKKVQVDINQLLDEIAKLEK